MDVAISQLFTAGSVVTRRGWRAALVVTVAVALLSASPARAAEPPPAGTSAAAAQSTSAPAPAPAAGGPDLNFDLDEGTKPALSPEQEKAKAAEAAELAKKAQGAKLRRPMLRVHMIMGFATLAALTATVVIGHLNYYDQYTSGDFTGRYENAHLGLAVTTSSLFGSTALLALTAPYGYRQPSKIRFDTALLHKVSMALASAGMITQIILGSLTVAHGGRLDQPNLALGHVVTGYATWAFMATGTIAYMF